MNAKQIIGYATTATLAIMAAQAAAAFLGAPAGSLKETAIKIAAGTGGVVLAAKLAR